MVNYGAHQQLTSGQKNLVGRRSIQKYVSGLIADVGKVINDYFLQLVSKVLLKGVK